MSGGRRKNKKKSKGKDEKGPNSDGRTYLKIKAFFKCSSDKCKKTWTSVHAWERDEEIYCEFCDCKAKVVDFKDEMCDVDNYNCGCGDRWQSIHSGNDEECWTCGSMVTPAGTQNRFGRHFWIVCTGCKTEWEDFATSSQRTQRCSVCKSRGDILKITKVQSKPFWLLKREQEKRERDGGGGGGKHNWEYCDMCQDLKGQGKASTCLNFYRVQCQIVQLDDGISVERIVGTS